jgi:BirA family biotin operon repressor/biotin-[acetyl-CoA-carboxylase] ligase
MPEREARVGRVVAHLGAAGSTNDLALAARQDGAVFVADTQHAGRGRRGRAWESRPGLGLWFSVALAGPPDGLNFAVPLALRTALAPAAPVALRWPNDLLLEDKKLGGILIEHRAGWTALGVGINVAHQAEDFAPDLRPLATSLALATRRTWNRWALLREILAALDAGLRVLGAPGGADAARAAWCAAWGQVGRPFRRGGVSGVVEGVAENGALILRADDGARRVLQSDPEV